MRQDAKKRIENIEEKSRKCLRLIQRLLNTAMATVFAFDIGYAIRIIYWHTQKTRMLDLNLELLIILFLSGGIIFLIYRARENVQYLYDFVMQIQALLSASGQKSETRMRILIIDDNAISRIILKNMLAGQPIDIEEAESGCEGIAILKQKRIDMVFLDYLMPKQNGIETAKKIRESGETWSGVRIVALSANDEVSLRLGFQREQVNELIKKPFVMEQVLACIKEEPIEAIPGKREEQKQIDSTTDKKTKLQNCLASVNGLHYEDGMKYSVGNEEQYEQILKLSAEYIKKFVLELPHYIEIKDQERILYELHAIRGILAHIGAEVLYKEAEEVEHQIKTDNNTGEPQIEHLIQQITVFQCELEHAISAYNSSGTKERVIKIESKSQQEMEQLRKQAVFYANNYEYNEMMDALQLLQEAGKQEWKDSIEKAIQAAGAFEYEKVKELLSAIH